MPVKVTFLNTPHVLLSTLNYDQRVGEILYVGRDMSYTRTYKSNDKHENQE